MLWRIDPGRDEPVYQQLVTQVHQAIVHGELENGERLPAARDLAASLDINIHTVLHAYQQLREDGVLDVRRGRGAVIVARAAHNLNGVFDALQTFINSARTAGLSPASAAILVREVMTA